MKIKVREKKIIKENIKQKLLSKLDINDEMKEALKKNIIVSYDDEYFKFDIEIKSFEQYP